MQEGYIINLGPCIEQRPIDGISWDAADPLIMEGIYNLIPELHDEEVVHSIRIPMIKEAVYECVKKCRYVIQFGTPSWYEFRNRMFWQACMEYKKRISFLGVGIAIPYECDLWKGKEDIIRLRDSNLIDTIVCRDPYSLYWLRDRCCIPGGLVYQLPCPGFYSLPMREKPVESKTNVVFSIANEAETSVSTKRLYQRYFEDLEYTAKELEHRGAKVHFSYQRYLPSFMEFDMEFKAKMPAGRTFTWFPSYNKFNEFHSNKDVYIGFRNHGALPCAGSGMPSLLLGTDSRQMLAMEVPYISRFDFSYTGFDVRTIIDWYNTLHPLSISQSLLSWRKTTTTRWQTPINKVRVRAGINKKG